MCREWDASQALSFSSGHICRTFSCIWWADGEEKALRPWCKLTFIQQPATILDFTVQTACSVLAVFAVRVLRVLHPLHLFPVIPLSYWNCTFRPLTGLVSSWVNVRKCEKGAMAGRKVQNEDINILIHFSFFIFVSSVEIVEMFLRVPLLIVALRILLSLIFIFAVTLVFR